MDNMSAYQRKLVLESLQSHQEVLEKKTEVLEELKGEMHVVQELDEMINDMDITIRSLSELKYKFL